MSHSRPTNALLYYHGCSARYYSMDNPKCEIGFVNAGDIIFIPSGSRYSVEFLKHNGRTPHTVLIEFTLLSEDGMETEITLSDEPFVVEHSGKGGIYDKVFEIADEYKSLNKSPAMVKSLVYRLLAELSKAEYLTRLNSKRFSVISRGIIYLEENYDKNPSVRELAKMCAVSESCFRELFRGYAGMTPTEFIAVGRLQKAKRMLSKSGLTVSQISDALGFYDTGHFCHFFKTSTGITAGEWRTAIASGSATVTMDTYFGNIGENGDIYKHRRK